MKLLAESGSTKTHWGLLDNNKLVKEFYTLGINPLILDESLIVRELGRISVKCEEVDEVIFYGAGCQGEKAINRIKSAFSTVFKYANTFVYTDLMASILGCTQGDKGIVGILGTGSNACYYDGTEIHQLTPSLGYVLGDEGSGNHMGKKLLKAYFYNYLPSDLKLLFEQEYRYTRSDFIDQVYRKPFPNRHLASFSPFIFKNKAHSFIQDIINSSFSEFVDFFIQPLCSVYESPLYLTGSVAHFYQEEITAICLKRGIVVQNILQNPFQNLVTYHTTIVNKLWQH